MIAPINRIQHHPNGSTKNRRVGPASKASAGPPDPAQPNTPSPPSQISNPESEIRRRRRKPWTPSDRDHLIYRWVKLEGERQSWVAQQFSISQATVSRIIHRYERWQAHAQPGEDGRLNHEERLRQQRLLTFERNEAILTSCLRIAGQLQEPLDVSRSTTIHPISHPSHETKIRTEHSCLDRTGMAARFLRLAFRINMEQLKLAEMEPLPPLRPLKAKELKIHEEKLHLPPEEGRSEGEAVAVVAVGCISEAQCTVGPDLATQIAHLRQIEEQERAELAAQLQKTQSTTHHSPTLHSPANLNTLHTATANESLVTIDSNYSCDKNNPPRKKSKSSYIPLPRPARIRPQRRARQRLSPTQKRARQSRKPSHLSPERADP